MRAAVICVGNELMLDDGVGLEIYRQLAGTYLFPDGVDVLCAGCMTLDMVSKVDEYDLIISVDAIDGTDAPAGTIFRCAPDDIARRGTPMGSLHELKLADLFDAASLLGYTCEGVCLGMQVENSSPSEYVMGLTPAVLAAVPNLVDAVLAELHAHGCEAIEEATGKPVGPGFHHRMTSC